MKSAEEMLMKEMYDRAAAALHKDVFSSMIVSTMGKFILVTFTPTLPDIKPDSERTPRTPQLEIIKTPTDE